MRFDNVWLNPKYLVKHPMPSHTFLFLLIGCNSCGWKFMGCCPLGALECSGVMVNKVLMDGDMNDKFNRISSISCKILWKSGNSKGWDERPSCQDLSTYWYATHFSFEGEANWYRPWMGSIGHVTQRQILVDLVTLRALRSRTSNAKYVPPTTVTIPQAQGPYCCFESHFYRFNSESGCFGHVSVSTRAISCWSVESEDGAFLYAIKIGGGQMGDVESGVWVASICLVFGVCLLATDERPSSRLQVVWLSKVFLIIHEIPRCCI